MIDDSQAQNRRLIEELEQANSRLLQSEKLAAIGQLAAGVAHEINNPVGYIASNLKTLTGYAEDLLRIVDAGDASPAEQQALKQRLEYDYLREDLMALIGESLEGIERVKTIVAALKDFSHIEEQAFQRVDLHKGLDTTLKLAANELKYKAEVVTAYGELPEIDCMPSQIKQVALNLLTNAAHAIKGQGRVTVRTGHAPPWVWFEVEDSGRGIAPEHLPRLFEPFFTTKPVGEGTGLGLALSWRIVEKHGGHVDVSSEPGTGSRFRVWLPIDQAVAGQEVSSPT